MSDETTTNAPTPDPAPQGEPAATPAPEPAPAPETPAGDKPAEGEPTPAAAAETPEITKARKILAAASKRAERALAREQAAKAIEGRAKEYDDLRAQIRANPLALIQLGGYENLKAYMQAVVDSGATSAPQVSPEARRLEAIEQRIQQEDHQAAQEARAERIEAAQKKVMAAIDADPKMDRATGDLGHRLIWQEILAYHEIHNDVPDEIVWRIARDVEAYLTKEGMGARRKAANAKAEASGEPLTRTMTNGMTRTSAPGPDGDDGLPMDGKARMAAILARYGKPSAPVS